MEISIEQYNLIQRYLDNEMTSDEESKFEHELDKNEDLKAYYIFETELRNNIDILQLEKDIPGSALLDEQEAMALQKVPEIIPESKSGRTKVFQFKRWIVYAAAACIIGIIALLFVLPSQKQTVTAKNKPDTSIKNKDSSSNFASTKTGDTANKKITNKEIITPNNVTVNKPKNKNNHPENPNIIVAQNGTQKILQSSLIKVKSNTVDALKIPMNEKSEVPDVATRGDVYGPNYTDIEIYNQTNYIVDIYINGTYKGSVAPRYKIITWSIPGSVQLYAKATFNDGTYYYWGPNVVLTGYEYTWQLHY